MRQENTWGGTMSKDLNLDYKIPPSLSTNNQKHVEVIRQQSNQFIKVILLRLCKYELKLNCVKGGGGGKHF